MNEFAFIDTIKARVFRHPLTQLGIGDDTAHIQDTSRGMLVASDMIVEGTHFDLLAMDPYLIGRKALAVNLSDIAAMGGQAVAATLCIHIPKGFSATTLQRVMDGFLDLAHDFGVELIGGDTTSGPQQLTLAVTILGVPHRRGIVTRAGSKVGDRIFVTGPLGGSLNGHHLEFIPRLKEAQQILDLVPVHSMIDLSDGLASDLGHVCAQSNVGATLYANKIPLSSTLAHETSDEALDHALIDGEDFELCFTVSENAAMILQQAPLSSITLHEIGEITSEKGISLIDAKGTKKALHAMGYRHSF